jgi:hypothetical protein
MFVLSVFSKRRKAKRRIIGTKDPVRMKYRVQQNSKEVPPRTEMFVFGAGPVLCG